MSNLVLCQTHQLIRAMEYVTSGFGSTVVDFLDINKAYDCKWHMGLIYKLLSMNFPGELIRVIDSFLALRFFRVKMDGAFSGWKPMLAGVAHRYLLSPMFYNLYTSDIPKSIV